MEIMVVLSKHQESRTAKKIMKVINKSIPNPLINVSEEIEVFIEDDNKIYLERLKKLAEENGYDMEVIK